MNSRPRLVKMFETKAFKEHLAQVNNVLSRVGEQDMDVYELNAFSYGSALYMQGSFAPWVKEEDIKSNDYRKEPPWKTKIKNKIN